MKRKTLAILLTVLLVVSAALVLTACKKEYTVTFREANSRKLEEVTTVKGIATPSEKTTQKAGYTLEGWYKTVDADEDGRYIFKDKVDLATEVFTEDTDLYANWTRNLSKGESEGYCLIGIIGGVTNWQPDERAEDESVQFTYAEDPINLYTITLDLKGLDEIKVKTSYPDWDTKEINYGGDKVSSITKAEDATLPAGVESVEDLFALGGNIGILCDMNVTIKFFYAGKLDSYIEIVVNSTTGDVVKPINEVGFIMVGTVTGWAEKIAADNETLAKYILATEDNETFTLSGIELAVGAEFKFKVNENGWGRGEYGFGKISVVEFADSVTERPDVEDAIEVFGGSSDDAKGNIAVRYAMTINVTFDSTDETIAIEITAIDPTAPKSDDEIGFFVVCTANDFYAVDAVEATDETNGKYVMTADADNAKLYTLTGLKIGAGQAFRIKLNQAGWSGTQFNYTNATFELAKTVTLPEEIEAITDMFEDAGEGMDNHNIIVKGANLTINLALDTSAEEEQLVITVTSVELMNKTDDELGYIVIGDPTAWNNGIDPEDTVNAKYIMTVDETDTHLFTYGEISLLRGNNFRVKTNNNAWSGTQYGFTNAKFEFAAGVAHEGIETSDLFEEGDDNNIKVKCKAAKVTLSLNTGVEEGEYALTVTITELVDGYPEDATVGYIITGTMSGNFPTTIASTSTAYAKYIFTKESAHVFVIEEMTIAANASFRVKSNKAGWTQPQFNFTNAVFTYADGISGPGAAAEDASKLFKDLGGDDHNIGCKVAMKVSITLTTNVADGEKELAIVVTECNATELPLDDNEKGIVLCGTINNWQPGNETYKFTPNEDNTIFTIEGVELAANAQFKMKVAESSWGKEWGYHGENMTVILGENVEPGTYIGDSSGNILIKKACTINITLNYLTGKYTITIVAPVVEPEPEPTPEPEIPEIEE